MSVHKCTWHQDTLGCRSMINFIVVSSDLRPYILDTWVKRGAELSSDHSWIRWRGRMPVRPGRPKRVMRVCWEHLADGSSTHTSTELQPHSKGGGDIESEWGVFRTSIAEAVDQSCGHKVVGACHGGNPPTRWWTPRVREAVRLKKESYRVGLLLQAMELSVGSTKILANCQTAQVEKAVLYQHCV